MFDSRFRPRQRVIEWKGRQIVCRPPTLETLCLVFERLGAVIEAMAERAEVISSIDEQHRVRAVCSLLAQYPEVAAPLETCTGPLPELEKSADLRLEVMLTLVTLFDLKEVLGNFNFQEVSKALEDSEFIPPPTTDMRDEWDEHLLRTAHLFGCSPAELWTWPVDALLFTLAKAPALAYPMMTEGEASGIDLTGEPVESLAAMGIPVYTTRRAEA